MCMVVWYVAHISLQVKLDQNVGKIFHMASFIEYNTGEASTNTYLIYSKIG